MAVHLPLPHGLMGLQGSSVTERIISSTEVGRGGMWQMMVMRQRHRGTSKLMHCTCRERKKAQAELLFEDTIEE